MQGTTFSHVVNLDLSASDYLEVYTYIYNTAGGTYQAMSNECIFQGYKLIGV